MFIYFCVLDPSLNLLVLVISGRREKWKWVEKEREKWKEVLWDAAMNKLQGMSLNLLDNVLDYGISVQSLSPVQFFVTPWTTARQTSPFITTSRSLPNLMSAVSFSYHLLLLPSIFPTIRVFSSESTLQIKWPKYWNSSVLPLNTQDWFPLGLTCLISLQSKRFSGVFSSTIIWKHLSDWLSFYLYFISFFSIDLYDIVFNSVYWEFALESLPCIQKYSVPPPKKKMNLSQLYWSGWT